jgi:hypothetical protein
MDPSDPLEQLDDVIAELEGEDWDDADEITAEHLIDAVKAGAVLATGRHQTLKMDDVTPTDPPRKLISDPPKSGIPGLVAAVTTGAARIVAAVNNVYALLGLALLVAAFIAWLRLRP